MQAQDYAGAKWALAQRVRGATDADIEREIAEGHILRTHVLRPTWHFAAPEDIRWMLALTAPRVIGATAYNARFHELDAALFRRSNDALARALSGGKHLTRAELAKALGDAGVRAASGQRLAHLMMRAELDAVVCSGGRRGKQFTYALLDERVPPTAPIERDEALLALTRRYFATRGPASARDFAWWSGLTMADAKRGLQMAGPELEKMSLDAVDLWFAPGVRAKSSRSAHLLPNYDEYFIGYRDRGAIGERVGHTRAVTGGDARIAHVAFVDGQLVGEWKRTTHGDTVVVGIRPASKLSTIETAMLEKAAKAFSKFLDVPVEIRWLDKQRRRS